MSISPLAGKPASPAMLIDVPRLVAAYYTERPDPSIADQKVAFGTSGHRGSSLAGGFNDGAPIGGIKVLTPNGWFAARPSGTEQVHKIYAESFKGPEHLRRIQEEAQAIVGQALKAARAASLGTERDDQSPGTVLAD